ncbi:MAG: serine/threonine protein kinase [Muribaculaceae bacterium]|nr:serine/threonine protein kinase [Muribaculaceae bacterium]
MSKEKLTSGALPIGTVLHSPSCDYIVIAVLGAGGFGITYRVTRQSDGRILALKEYFPDKLCERGDGNTMSYLKTNAQTIETGLKDFITEAGRLDKQNISHPNIVQIEEVFNANDTAYYAMEYIDGRNLYQYVKASHGRPMSVEQVLSVMRPVLQAVSVLHKNRLTHLDLKHENIILTTEDDGSLRPVIIDFGQSKHYDKKGKATSQLTNAGCSEGFAPPEQYHGLTKFTPQADVYALCATMLYLLSGKQPIKSSDMSATVITSTLPEDIPERIKDALIRGMRRDMDDRLQSVEQLAEALGIDISSQDREGNVTRLLNLKTQTSFDPKKLIKPAIAVGILAAIGFVAWWISSRFSNSSATELPSDSTAVLTSDSTPTDLPPLTEGTSMVPETEKNNSLEQGEDSKVESKNESPEQKDLTDEEKFQKASKANDLSGMLALAKSGYVKAYYPLARMYYNRKDTGQAEAWAKKAIAANVDKANAQSLIANIAKQKADSDQPASVSNDELFAKATTIADFRSLANKGYAKAYAPLAELYLNKYDYENAHNWAVKAGKARVGVDKARSVVNKLDAYGFYRNNEYGGKPNF